MDRLNRIYTIVEQSQNKFICSNDFHKKKRMQNLKIKLSSQMCRLTQIKNDYDFIALQKRYAAINKIPSTFNKITIITD